MKEVEGEKDNAKVIAIMVDFFTNQNKTLVQGLNKHQELQVTLSNAIESVITKW